MLELSSKALLIIAISISAVLFFVLALYKRYAYFWWAMGGIVVCFPIAIVSYSISKIKFVFASEISIEIIFAIIYAILYLCLWIFLKRSAITEEQKKKREKLDEAIFDGFLALKEKRIKDAYGIFRKAYLVDPDNPVIKSILSSFQESHSGLIKKNRFSEWKYRIMVSIKEKMNKRKNKAQKEKE